MYSNRGLHIFDSTTSATSLIIQNNNMIMTSNTTQGTTTVTGSVTTGGTTTSEVQYIATFSTNGPSTHDQITSSTDRYMIFTTASVNHTFTIPSGDINCDILMIGGGGGGGRGYDYGADLSGGGAGACIVSINQKLPAGTCVVRVGAGGSTWNANGVDSYIQVNDVDRYRAKGGGGGSHRTTNSGVGLSGGCGGGATWTTDNGAVNNGGTVVSTNTVTINDGTTNTLGPYISDTHRFAVMGNAGGTGSHLSGLYQAAGGGGGIGGVGGFRSGGGNGKYNVTINGTTYNFRDWFANGGAFGADNGYIGGGGAANSGGYYSGGLGGGGGAQRVASYNTPSPGAANTGSGGSEGGSGGSGIVIIRYRYKTVTETVNTTLTTTTYTHQPTTTTTLSTPTLGTPSIELVRGTQGDSNTDYKIGNYNGDFIVRSSISGVDTDYIRIVGTSASIFNSTASPQWSTVSDKRIKENIEKASYDKCFDTINKLELYRFNYIKELNSINKDKTQLGYIAQEVNDVFPKAVSSYEFNNTMLSIPDLLSIDIAQINYSLYGAVKKLIEINNNKEVRLKKLESILNIECDSSNVAIVEDAYVSSNIAIVEDVMSSNVAIVEDTYVSSNVAIVEDTYVSSNVAIVDYVMSSNVAIVDDTYVSSNIAIVDDVMSSNVAIVEDVMSSNVAIVEDVMSSNVAIVEDVMSSNVAIVEDVMSSNVAINNSNV